LHSPHQALPTGISRMAVSDWVLVECSANNSVIGGFNSAGQQRAFCERRIRGCPLLDSSASPAPKNDRTANRQAWAPAHSLLNCQITWVHVVSAVVSLV